MPSPSSPFGLDVSFVAPSPEERASMIASFDMLPDAQADLVLDMADDTKRGGGRKVMRYAVGAGVGLVAGFLLSKVLG